MNITRKFVTSLLLLTLLFAEACNKKKVTLPPHSLAPTIAVALPDEIPEKPETPAPVVAQTPEEPPPVKTKPKKPARTVAKKPSQAPNPAPPAVTSPAPTNNEPTVASLQPPRSAAAVPDTAIAAALPSAEVNRQKTRTAQIIDSTESSLKNLSRSLSDDEKAMRSQIQLYIQQSRKATGDGDFERAYNLAQKAQLLAEALIQK